MSPGRTSSRPTSKKARRPKPSPFDELVLQVLAFRDRRDWRQFHNPKDLSISISLEAAELLFRVVAGIFLQCRANLLHMRICEHGIYRAAV